jgi:hypothetical protein
LIGIINNKNAYRGAVTPISSKHISTLSRGTVMPSNYIYTPYFYIIQHKETHKKYAGSRWAKECNPKEFMKEGGYTTSSKTINEIIKSQGLNIFEIVDIITIDELNIPFGTNSIYDYETWFLITNNCANSDNWYNSHNNMGMAFGTKTFIDSSKETFLKKYGVVNPFESSIIKEKIKQSNNDSLGVDYPMQSKLVQDKSKKSCQEKYGYDYTSQVPEIRKKQTKTRFNKNNGKYFSNESLDKKQDTCLEKYGVTNPMQYDEFIFKSKNTKLDKYGDENYNNIEKNKKTRLQKYGDENYNNIEKNKETCLKNYGVDNVFKSESVKQKIYDTNLSLYGVKYISEIKVKCPYCDKVGGKPSMSRWHFDNCKYKEK